MMETTITITIIINNNNNGEFIHTRNMIRYSKKSAGLRFELHPSLENNGVSVLFVGEEECFSIFAS